MIRVFCALLIVTVLAGCGGGETGVQTVGGVDFKLETVPDPPKAGRVRVELTARKNGKPFRDAAIDMVISNVTRGGTNRDVYLNDQDGKLVGLIDVHEGKWKLEAFFTDVNVDRKVEFYIDVE